MNGIEYQMAAMRTNDGRNRDRLLNAVSTTNGIDVAELLNGVIGLTGESGEVADLVKKGVFHEKGIDINHLKKECGDVMWYVAMICEDLPLMMLCRQTRKNLKVDTQMDLTLGEPTINRRATYDRAYRFTLDCN